MNIAVEVGNSYNTRGGWVVFIYALVDGNPAGFCKNPATDQMAPLMGIWNKEGQCIKRGDSTDESSTAPYDIID